MLDSETDTTVPCKVCRKAICKLDYGPNNVSCSDPCCKCGIVLCKGCIEANNQFPSSYFGDHRVCGKRECADRFDREGGDSDSSKDNEEGDGEGAGDAGGGGYYEEDSDSDGENQWGFVKFYNDWSDPTAYLWVTPLQLAVTDGNVEDVKTRLEEAGEDPNDPSELDFTAIMFAVESKSATREIVETLLSHGADPTQKDCEGYDAYDVATKAARAWLPPRRTRQHDNSDGDNKDGDNSNGDDDKAAGVKRSSPLPSSPPSERPSERPLERP